MVTARLPRRLRAAIPAWVPLAALALLPDGAAADKLILKDGKAVYGTITDERDSLIRYFDRYDRPRRLEAARVDTIHYDADAVEGRVKVAFRKGQPGDHTGFFRLKHSEELDLDVEYRTDSASELDLFFRNNAHVRVLPECGFRVEKAPRSEEVPAEIALLSGRMLITSGDPKALVRIVTPGGVGVGRGVFQIAVQADSADSSLLVSCLKGLCGVQESRDNPGELVVEPGQATSVSRKSGVFEPREADPERVRMLGALAANVGHYRFSRIEYPKPGYLPRAIAGLGFMVFFYGSAIGILDYVNNI